MDHLWPIHDRLEQRAHAPAYRLGEDVHPVHNMGANQSDLNINGLYATIYTTKRT